MGKTIARGRRRCIRGVLRPPAGEAHVKAGHVYNQPDHGDIGGVALHAMHRRRVGELQVLPRILGRHSPQLAAVANRHKIDALVADAADDPVRTILNACEPVVAAGLDGVADEDALLPHPPRDHAGIQLTVIDSPVLDRVVDASASALVPGTNVTRLARVALQRATGEHRSATVI